MKNNKTALYAIAFILIGGLVASPSMQIGGIAFAQDDTDEFESPNTHSEVDEVEAEEVDADEAKEVDVDGVEDEADDNNDSDVYDSDDTKKYDEYDQMGTYEDHREMADKYCSLSEAEQEDMLADNQMMRENKSKLDEYCELDESDKEQYVRDRMVEMRDMMNDHMKDRMGHDYVRDFDMRIAAMCDMSDEQKRKLMSQHEFIQEHHERIAEYCNMSEQEREDYRMTHADMMEDYEEDFAQMHDKMMDASGDMKMKIHDKMRDYDISDERRDAIHDKFRMKHADLTDVQRDEMRDNVKAKYMDHIKTRMNTDAMSDLQKDQILQRIAEMKDYKADLRLKYKDMSEDERIQFQAEFRDKVSDKRFAWISPHKQMLAGIAVDELECREGLNLVLKSSNGKAMCVKSVTAERLIENGIAVPAA